MSIQTLAIHQVTIERKAVTRDTMGGQVETWAKHAIVSARVQPLSARESQQYSRETESVTHKIYVPGAPDIRHDDRALFRGKTYIIRGVRNTDEMDHHLVLEADVQT